MSKKKKHRAFLWKNLLSDLLVITVVAALVLLALIHYDQETPQNTYTESGIIYDVEEIRGKNQRWTAFSMNGQRYYYRALGSGSAKMIDQFQRVEDEKLQVTITITDEVNYSHLLDALGKKKVVAVQSAGDLNIPIEQHNKDQRFRQIFYLALATLILGIFLLWKIHFWWISKSLKDR